MTYHLFLDDERMPSEVFWITLPKVSFVIVRSYHEFIDYIETNGVPVFVSFDHDLGDYTDKGEKTGYDCAKWLIDYCFDNGEAIPDFETHTMNPIGGENIRQYLRSAKRLID